MLKFMKKGMSSARLSSKETDAEEDQSRQEPIPVQKLKDAQDLAAQLIPASISPDEPIADMDDGLTQEDKMFAIGLLDASGRTRVSNGAVTWHVKAKQDAEGNEISPAFSCEYGWVCQTGFYPEDLNKKNQDNLLVEAPFNNDDSKGLFCVFDGHGKAGTECSTFAVNRLSRNLRADPRMNNEETFTTAFREAFVKTNKEMHAQKRLRKSNPAYFDDTHAGTTAITVFFDGANIVVGNVGDSRAIVASRDSGMLKAFPLSVDQTPYRKDERDRCTRAGAVVMTMDQLEGYKPYDPNADDWGTEEDDDGDPPRLWLPNRGGPGVAFTRSLGDELAERIGCHADPEILHKTLTHDDQFIVIASDGVFEFLSSQTVVDMVAKFEDPVEAAQALVAEAYKLWLHYEVRTDDITAIVIQLKGFRRGTIVPPRVLESSAQAVAKTESDMLLLSSRENRPVRREMSRKKREMIAAKMVSSPEDLETPREGEGGRKKSYIPKSKEEYEQIRMAVKANFLFSHLNDSQLMDVLHAFAKQEVNPGDTIIEQGEDGDKFYVVGSGEYECFVAPTDPESGKIVGEAKLVHNYVSNTNQIGNPSFGELALMYSKPRAATVTAKCAGHLWALDRFTFRRALIKRPNKEIVHSLKIVPALATLGRSQLQRLADILTEEHYEDGSLIITQGEIGDTFYIVRRGSVRCTIDDEDNAEKRGAAGKEVLRISQGGYFGERALLQSEPRAANVIAVGEVTCLYISRQAFEEVLGPLGDIIAKESSVRQAEGVAMANSVERRSAEGLDGCTLASFKSKAEVCSNPVGVVHLVVCESTGNMYTMKCMDREKSELEKETTHVMRDRQLSLLIGDVGDKAVAPVLGTFIGKRTLSTMYAETIVGELSSFMNEPFDIPTAQFVARSCVDLLRAVHSKEVICRSINPDMLVLTHTGAIKLIDFRYSKSLEDGNDRAYTMCGLATYLSPEQVLNQGHGRACDWWGLGILLYEMVTGSTPFAKKTKDGETEEANENLFEQITSFDSSALSFPDSVPEGDCRDVIRALLTVDEAKRLGSRNGTSSAEQVLEHPFFASTPVLSVSPFESVANSSLQDLASGQRASLDESLDSVPKDAWYAGF